MPSWSFFRANWRWIAVVIVLVVGLWYFSRSAFGDVCASQSFFANGTYSYFDCIDFWMNRYQTLISGALAVIAASYAARLVRKQLAAMSYQNELVDKSRAIARFGTVVTRYKEIRTFHIDELSSKDFINVVRKLYIAVEQRDLRAQRVSIKKAMEESDRLTDIFETIIKEYRGGPAVVSAAIKLQRVLVIMHNCFVDVYEVARGATDARTDIDAVIQEYNLAIARKEELLQKDNAFRAARVKESRALRRMLRELNDQIFD